MPDLMQPETTPGRPPTRRRVIHVSGFHAMRPENFVARFRREIARFERCWAVSASSSAPEIEADVARWHATASGPDWQTQVDHFLLRWDDVIAAEHQRSYPQRWHDGLSAGLDFTINGALWKYLRHGPRYAVFFIFPFVLIALCLALSIMLASLLTPWLGMIGGLVIGLASWPALLVLAGRKLWLDQLLDDWAFASRHVRTLDPTLAGRIGVGAQLVAQTPADTELLVIGHSLGAAVAVEMLAEAVTAAPEGPPIRFLTIGSSILKLGFHAKAIRLRQAVETVASSPRVIWAEYQAVNDAMNFFKSDPVKLLRTAGRSPIVRAVRFGSMLDPAFYATIRVNFFRLHNQFVSGNDRRAPYDYLMTVAGPFPLEELARSRLGAIEWLGERGELLVAHKAPEDS